MKRATHPAPMSWSTSMSEIGPIRVRSPTRCRMISWPAANGIAASSAVPMQTEAPAGTKRAMASDIEVSFGAVMESRILPGLMFHYVIRRLLWLVPTILAMALVTFTIMHATPGSPLDPVAEGANPLSPEAQKNLAEHYGLDKPLYHQFGIFVWKALHGDFGNSFVYKTRTVREIIVTTFPISLFLGTMAFALAVVGGLTFGILAATHQHKGWDYVSVSLAPVGVAIPHFVLAVYLIILFSFVIPLFPTGGWDSWKNWALPTVTLALRPMGSVARFT